MTLKFSGGYAKLQRCMSRTGLPGKWRELKYGQWQYRTKKGGVLNWWETTGTFTFQGLKDAAREELERAFIASAGGRPHREISRPRVVRTTSKPISG